MAVGEDASAAEFPEGAGSAGRLTVYCGRGERSRGSAAYRAVVDLLRRQGARGATVLLGVDGIHNGQRWRAGLLSRNVNVPVATIAVGPTHVLRRVLQALPDVLARPVANLERIAVVKHDGDLLEPLPLISDSGEGEPPVWMALRIYTRQSARADGGAVYTTLTRRLREAGAAGITTLRGEWGFSSDERPFGDRFGTLASHVPTYSVFVDRPSKIAEIWPIVDEITAQHGVVTAALVPAYRERAGTIEHGRLTVRSTHDIAELYRSQRSNVGFLPRLRDMDRRRLACPDALCDGRLPVTQLLSCRGGSLTTLLSRPGEAPQGRGEREHGRSLVSRFRRQGGDDVRLVAGLLLVVERRHQRLRHGLRASAARRPVSPRRRIPGRDRRRCAAERQTYVEAAVLAAPVLV